MFLDVSALHAAIVLGLLVPDRGPPVRQATTGELLLSWRPAR